MTSMIFKNPNRFNQARLVLSVLTGLFFFFMGMLLSMADVAKTKTNQVTRKKPVNITSSQLFFNKLKGLTLFKGKVKALHGEVVLTADEIRAFSDNNVETAKGHVKVIDKSAGVTLTCGNLDYQDQMEIMTAHDHPVLLSVDNQKKPVTIIGRQMVVDSEEKTIVVNQNVEIDQAESKAEAQKATFFTNENKLILEDDPKVYTSSGQITARRITTVMGQSFFAEGLADALFNPSGAPLPASKKDSKNQGPAGKNDKSGNSNTPNGPGLSGTPGIQPTVSTTPGISPNISNPPTVAPSPGGLSR
jgi:lipopolysaccharide export system protein LptA